MSFFRRAWGRIRGLGLLVGAAAGMALGSAPEWAPGWSEPVQLPLFGDQECSSSPDLVPSCCAQHDVDYGVGGAEQDRLVADLDLWGCLALHGVPEDVGRLYFDAVRRFGESSWRADARRSRGPD